MYENAGESVEEREKAKEKKKEGKVREKNISKHPKSRRCCKKNVFPLFESVLSDERRVQKKSATLHPLGPRFNPIVRASSLQPIPSHLAPVAPVLTLLSTQISRDKSSTRDFQILLVQHKF